MNTTLSSTQFRSITTSELAVATALLGEASLVVSDISEKVTLFGLFDGQTLLALGGLEAYQDKALLRSVCVPPQKKGKGYGSHLVRSIENDAMANGITDFYLLTTTAAIFFERAGYQTADRNTAPDVIKNTSEFSDLCPSSAVFMHKALDL